MPSYTIRVPTGVPASDALADLPSTMKALLKRGFEVIGRAPTESLSILADAAKDASLGRESEDSSSFPEVPGLNRQDVAAGLSVATMIASFLTVESGEYEELIEAALQQRLLDESGKERALDLAKRIDAYRAQMSAVAKSRDLANQTLPSFNGLSASVDLRVSFEGDRVALVVPVLVACLRTDVADDLWFQMTEDEVDGLTAQLQRLLKQMQIARRLVPSDRKGTG